MAEPKPKLLDFGIPFNLLTMYENKDAEYEDFLKALNESYKSETGEYFDSKIFDMIECPNTELVVSEIAMDEEDGETFTRHTLFSKDVFTVGKLLQSISKVMQEPTETFWLSYLYFDEELNAYSLAED